ncbi:acyltransferase [uncultured Thiothrix sp.]|uniref:acyltransferase family protein n=1 Tax=uncultured Thiothrix sp. TaxID=223185 RepID=UPI002629D763|nr:acyltransferase [uncultured Thiothrix sp.]HMT94846.1 acyltransferase [Thiolinea sp.]
MKLDQLTFTRYIAALTVVFFHFGQQAFPATNTWWHPIVTAGPIAVSFFFVLSGFIMAVAYYQPERPRINKTKYWLARFARIYPVYLLALVLMILANLKTDGRDPAAVGLSLTMLQAWIPGYAMVLNSPGWSLSVEALFYLSFPFLLYFVHAKGLKALKLITLSLWLGTQLLQIVLHNYVGYEVKGVLHQFIYYHPLMHMSTFMLGLVVGMAFCKGDFSKLNQPWNGLGILTLTVLVILLLAYEASFEQQLGFLIDYNNGLIAPVFLAILVLLAVNNGWTKRFMSLPFLVLLGEASYSLYILQRPVYGIYDRVVGHWLPLDANLHYYLFAILLTVASILSFKYMETPLRRLINSFYGSSGKASSST